MYISGRAGQSLSPFEDQVFPVVFRDEASDAAYVLRRAGIPHGFFQSAKSLFC
jgi:hypothetical protein